MDLILFGRQGSGKGTQGKYFSERYGLSPFVMGDELRRLATENSDLGKKVKTIIEAGHLVSDDIVMKIIEHFMAGLPEGARVIFDGIPRKMGQALAFDALMERTDRSFTGVVLDISENTAVKRLTSRRICTGCKAVYPATYDKSVCEACGGTLETRADDSNLDSIRNRLDAYNNETVPVIEHYREQNKLIELSGEHDIDTVNNNAFSVLDPLFL